MILVMILAISNAVSRKIGVVSELQNHCRAELKAYSAFNESVFRLLVSTYTPTGLQMHAPSVTGSNGQSDEKPASQYWNLYGEPIALEPGVEVVLRDTGGMISPVFPTDLLRRRLEVALGGQDRAASAIDALADWQDEDELRRLNGAEYLEYQRSGFSYKPRNSYIQCLSELCLVKGIEPAQVKAIENDLIYWPSKNTNYLTMSPEFLRILFGDKRGGDDLVNQLLELRCNGQLTPTTFKTLTGIQQGEYEVLYPTGKVQMTVKAKVANARSRIQAVVSKRPSSDKPYRILTWRR